VRLDVATGREQRFATGGHVGFALPAPAGDVVAGVERRIVRLAAPGAPEEVIAEVEPELAENRFNDAALDPAGRLWAGTMSRRRTPGAAALYRVSADGALERAIAGATISNGLDWNLDFDLLYYIDSTTQQIDAIAFDLDRGRLGARRRFAAIDPGDGLPDGLTVDAEGGVWLALFGGGAVRRYLPDGRLDAVIRLPVTNPTSLAFGGADLSDLYITSAKHRLTPEQLAREPFAGSVLRLRPGVRGRAVAGSARG
jgi:sugar lactone lactonase YvrE